MKETMRASATHIVDERGMLLDLEGQCLGGRFEILKRITCGSHAEIYLGRNLSPKSDEAETVVVKALNLSLRGEIDPALERTLIENMQLEASTLSRLRHDHIVRFYDCGTGVAEQTGQQFYYIVIEHLRGGDLSRLCRAQPLSLEQTLEYIRQICDALACAHSNNLIHRDIKPNNILVTADRRIAKLLDFGTARLLDRGGLITQVGTEVYAAPEVFSQAHTAKTLSPAADIYSLAKTAYYLLTGESPVHQKQRQITSLPPPIAGLPWANSVLSVLHKATSERPEYRYQSAMDFYKDLRDVTELTHVSPRGLREEILPDETPRARQERTRIEVPVIPKPPRDYGKIAKTALWLFFKYTKATSTVVAAGLGAAWLWLRPFLQRGGVTLAALVKWLWRSLRAMPRKLVTRILIVIAITLILLIMPPYLINWWRTLTVIESVQSTSNNPSTARETTTTTDLNIRSTPSSEGQRIGLAEHTSRVRVLSCNSDDTWCEIEVVQHGRAKKDADSADRGWVNKRFLAF